MPISPRTSAHSLSAGSDPGGIDDVDAPVTQAPLLPHDAALRRTFCRRQAPHVRRRAGDAQALRDLRIAPGGLPRDEHRGLPRPDPASHLRKRRRAVRGAMAERLRRLPGHQVGSRARESTRGRYFSRSPLMTFRVTVVLLAGSSFPALPSEGPGPRTGSPPAAAAIAWATSRTAEPVAPSGWRLEGRAARGRSLRIRQCGPHVVAQRLQRAPSGVLVDEPEPDEACRTRRAGPGRPFPGVPRTPPSAPPGTSGGVSPAPPARRLAGLPNLSAGGDAQPCSERLEVSPGRPA